jgi:hypothetical protein
LADLSVEPLVDLMVEAALALSVDQWAEALVAANLSVEALVDSLGDQSVELSPQL